MVMLLSFKLKTISNLLIRLFFFLDDIIIETPSLIQPKDEIFYFNQDITCSHNNLSPNENKIKVNKTIWNDIFKKYFHPNFDDFNASIFKDNDQECNKCLVI
jgi:hypothetical protein